MADGVPPLRVVAEGHAWHERNKDGPIASFRNAQIALLGLGAKFTYNEFRQRSFVDWHMFGEEPAEVSDRRATRLRQAIAAKYGFDPKRDFLRDAIAALCEDNSFDPKRDYFDSLEWDRKPRLDKWLARYMGAADTSLVREFGRKTLIAGIRRVRAPGCKFDTILVLEGEQGTGKSSALQILAGDPEYFTDQDILHSVEPRAQQEALAGKHIVELAELAGLRRNDSERVKAFASRQYDRSRGAYDQFVSDQPRRCIFIATTNGRDYLTDTTGNRRFWPVITGGIDLESLLADRDQLWAEAAHAEAAQESLTLDRELWADAASEQGERLEHHPWDDLVSDLIGARVMADGVEVERILSAKIFAATIEVPKERQSGALGKQLARSMLKAGWRGPETMRIGIERGKGYWRPARERRNE